MEVIYGINFGSSHISICQKDLGITLKEPSLIERIFIDENKYSYGLVGYEAKNLLLNKTNNDSIVISPIKDGVIARDIDGVGKEENKKALTILLSKLYKKVMPKTILKPKTHFYVLAECGLSVQEYNEFREVCYKVGADIVTFVPSPLCAIYGMGLEKSALNYFCMLDLGADNVNIYICGKDNVIDGISLSNYSGNRISEMIDLHTRSQDNLALDQKSIEDIKVNILSLAKTDTAECVVQGKSLLTGMIEEHKYTSRDFYNLIEYYFQKYAEETIKLIQTNRSYIYSIKDNKVIVYGGGAGYTGVKEFLKERLKFDVNICTTQDIALVGLTKLFNDGKLLKKITS
ncbi:MAG: rod shape-determining protein [Clostridia bacterium]|nr:rod shape-determining protein [Clostridia bacterium]